MIEPKLLFAYNKARELVHVEDVPNGLECGCFCPVCEGSLIARQGEVRVAHFAHVDASPCSSAAKIGFQLFAKQVLTKHPGLTIDERTLSQVFEANQGLSRAALETAIVRLSTSSTTTEFSPPSSVCDDGRANARVAFVYKAAAETMAAERAAMWLEQPNPILGAKTPRQVSEEGPAGIILCECALGLRSMATGKRLYPHLGDRLEVTHKPCHPHPLLPNKPKWMC